MRCFHVLKCLCIAHDAHSLSMDAPLQGDTGGHTGTAPTNLYQTPLPRNLPRVFPSAEPLPAIIFDFVCRQSLFRQPFLVFVHRRSLFRQPFLVFVRRRSLFRQPFIVLVRRRSLFRQPFLVLVRRRSLFRQPDDRLGFNGSVRPKHGSAASCLRQSEPWWPQRQQAVSRRWDGSSNRTCRRSR